MAANAQHLAALQDPLQYPGRMLTYPGKVKGQPAVFVHDCVLGCPGMPPRPIMPIAGAPEDAHTKDKGPTPGQGPPPGPPGPEDKPLPGTMMIGPTGDQIFFHPHYPTLKVTKCTRMLVKMGPKRA